MRSARSSSALSFTLGDAHEAIAGDDSAFVREREVAERHELAEMTRRNTGFRSAHRDLEQRGEFFRRQQLRRMDGHSCNSRLEPHGELGMRVHARANGECAIDAERSRAPRYWRCRANYDGLPECKRQRTGKYAG